MSPRRETFAEPGVGCPEGPQRKARSERRATVLGWHGAGCPEDPSPISAEDARICLSPWRDLCVTTGWLLGRPLTLTLSPRRGIKTKTPGRGRPRPGRPLTPTLSPRRGSKSRRTFEDEGRFAKVSLERVKSAAPLGHCRPYAGAGAWTETGRPLTPGLSPRQALTLSSRRDLCGTQGWLPGRPSPQPSPPGETFA